VSPPTNPEKVAANVGLAAPYARLASVARTVNGARFTVRVPFTNGPKV
jgi:hypothetical protein